MLFTLWFVIQEHKLTPEVTKRNHICSAGDTFNVRITRLPSHIHILLSFYILYCPKYIDPQPIEPTGTLQSWSAFIGLHFDKKLACQKISRGTHEFRPINIKTYQC